MKGKSAIAFSLYSESITYQLEYEPPGLLVTTRRVIPMVASSCIILTTTKPRNGKRTNWQKIPSIIAFRFFTCCFMHSVSTVADIPNTNAKRRKFPTNSRRDIIFEMVPEFMNYEEYGCRVLLLAYDRAPTIGADIRISRI